MSDEQDSLKDNKISRRQFIKLVGAGTVVAFGIPNVLKNIKEALAITMQESNATNATGAIAAPPSNNLNIRPFRVNVPEAELIAHPSKVVFLTFGDQITIYKRQAILDKY